MSKQYILAFDQGTTSTRAILFDEDGVMISRDQRPHKQIYTEPGWVAHNAGEIFVNVVETGRKALEQAGVKPENVAAVGITNQRETTVLWDRQTGEPVYEAIVWQCRRTAGICEQMERDGLTEIIRHKTGLLIDPYFSATKIKWVLDQVPQAQVLMKQGRLLAGTMDSYLIWKLTSGQRHVTDYTNASRTMLFNITDLKWDDDILAYFGIDRAILPEVIPCVGLAGCLEPHHFGAPIPITGVAGDQHAALFGQACLTPGEVKNTYGTGCFVLKNIGSKPLITNSRLLTTMAWYINGQPTYALEGSIFNAGSAVEWLMREVKLVCSTDEINAICAETTDTNGAYFVPAFSGLGAPYWDRYARGTLCGLSLSVNRNHIVRAIMESIAFQSRDVIDHMSEVSGLSLPSLRVDGGVSQSNFTMQFQSDLLQVPVERPRNADTTAEGVYYMAALGVGLFKEVSDIRHKRVVDRTFTPGSSSEEMNERYRLWKKAVDRARGWAE